MAKFKVKIAERLITQYTLASDEITTEEEAQEWVESMTKDQIEEASMDYEVIDSEYNAEAIMNIELIPVDEG